MNIKFILYQKNIEVCVWGGEKNDVGRTKDNMYYLS